MKTIYTFALNESRTNVVPVFEGTVLKDVIVNYSVPTLVFEAPVEGWTTPVSEDLIIETRVFDVVDVHSVVPDNYVYVGAVVVPRGVMRFVYEVCNA